MKTTIGIYSVAVVNYYIGADHAAGVRPSPHLLEKVCAPSQTLKLVIEISDLKVVNQKIQKLGAVQSSNVGCQCDSLFSLSKIRNRRISGPVLMDP